MMFCHNIGTTLATKVMAVVHCPSSHVRNFNARPEDSLRCLSVRRRKQPAKAPAEPKQSNSKHEILRRLNLKNALNVKYIHI